jgi:hypothetical protein
MLGVFDPATRRVAVEPVGDLVVAEEGGGGLPFGDLRLSRESRGRSDERDRGDEQQPAD